MSTIRKLMISTAMTATLLSSAYATGKETKKSEETNVQNQTLVSGHYLDPVGNVVLDLSVEGIKVDNDVKATLLFKVIQKEEFKKIEILNLSNLGMADTHIALILPAILEMKSLKSLILKNNPLLGDKGISRICDFLKKNQTVEFVDFTNTGVNQSGSESIKHVLQTKNKIKTVIVDDNPEINISFLLNLLGENETLETICIRNCGLPIFRSQNDYGMDSDGPNAYALLQFIQDIKNLRYLNLCGNKIQPSALPYISKGLDKNFTIVEINISNNKPLLSNENLSFFDKKLNENKLFLNKMDSLSSKIVHKTKNGEGK